MIGGLLDKITASLGKSYLFAGLLPAAVLLTVSSCYWLGAQQTWAQVPSFAASGDSIKTITAWGVLWLVLGFILFTIRTWIFSLFQIVPTGWLGSLLLRRSLRARGRLQRRQSRLEWHYTVVRWHEQEFSAEAAIYRPDWMKLPSLADALVKSKRARERLSVMLAYDVPEVYPSWSERCLLIDGLSQLFAIVTDRVHYQNSKAALDAELDAWKLVARRARRKAALQNLGEQIHRDWVSAFGWRLQYAKGPWIYPTAIGNRLAAVDDYAEQRYGISATAIWERLWWVLPSTAKQEVSDARLTVEVMLNLSAVLLTVATSIAASEISRIVAPLAASAPPDAAARGLMLIAACLLFGGAAYRGAVFALDGLASKMTTLIDMNRLQLLTALGVQPKTVADEVELLNEFGDFFVQASKRKPDRKLTLPTKSAEKTDKDADNSGGEPKDKKKAKDGGDEPGEES